jgi:ATP adenylyltransferase
MDIAFLWMRAKEAGDLEFTTTKVVIVDNFELRLIESLSQKPKLNQSSSPNPFLKPSPALYIRQVGKHNLLFNKYCIVKHHLILSSVEFESQFTLLDSFDFEAAFQVMDAYGPHLCFYNCGVNSGASILHKHIQMIPGGNCPLLPLLKDGGLPFVYRLQSISAQCTMLDIQLLLNCMLRDCIAEIRVAKYSNFDNNASCTREPDFFISYNVLFTREWIFVAPRTKSDFESVNVNALGFAGFMLVKSEDSLQLVRQAGPLSILSRVAYSIV